MADLDGAARRVGNHDIAGLGNVDTAAIGGAAHRAIHLLHMNISTTRFKKSLAVNRRSTDGSGTRNAARIAADLAQRDFAGRGLSHQVTRNLVDIHATASALGD